MNRAYAVLELKAVDADKRTFSGIATTPSTDRMGDIVEPKGAKFKLPLPLLWQHDSRQPIGWVTRARVSKDGIEIDGEIAVISEPSALQIRINEAWLAIKNKLVRGLSIGFSPMKDGVEPIDPKNPWGPAKFIAWEWLELSAVTIPANQDASITAIKSIDDRLRQAAPGRTTKASIPARAGAPNLKGNSMKTYTQQSLAGLTEARKTKAARMEELRDLKSGEGRKFTDEERAEFDGLDTEIEDLDDEIRVTQRHVTNIAVAKAVDTRAPYGFVKKMVDADEKFKGETGLKRAIAEIYAQSQVKKGNIVSPLEFVQERWGKTNPTLVAVMKAAVAGGGTESGEWGAELAQADTRFTGDFIEYLYAKTLFDQLPLVNVPHNVVIKGQDGAFTGYFIGQSKAIKVSKGDFSTTTTTGYKAAGLTVVSNELLRDSSPSALELCGTGLRNAVAQAVDSLFFSTTAVSAGVSPAGILNGVSIGASNGSDAQSIATDIKALWAPFITANNTEGNFVYITTPTIAIALSMMRNALGQLEFPGLTARGGTFGGYPLLTGGNVGAGDFILMNGSEVWRIGDLGVSLSTSDSAMIEQDNAPTGATDTPVAASATMVSMYQEDSTAIRVIRPISWGKRRAGAVAYIGNAAYGAEQS